MPKTNRDVIQRCVVINWTGLLIFTVVGASLASPPHGKWHWDTISQMVTRGSALENAFAVFLTASTIVLGYIIVSMMYRFQDAGLQGPNFAYESRIVFLCFSFAMISMIGIGIFSLQVDDDVHTGFAGAAFVLLWIGTTLLAWMHRKVQLHPSVAGVCVVVGGAAMLVLAVFSTGQDAHDRVQDNEAYFCEYILVTTMHIVLYTLAAINVNAKYNIHVELRHGKLGDNEKQVHTLIL